MATHEFQDTETGEIVEVLFLPGEELPPLGVPIGDLEGNEGRTLVRILSRPTISVKKGVSPFAAYSQPPWAKGAKRYDQFGAPLFASQREVDDYVDTQNKQVDADGRGETGGEYIGYGVT